MPSTIKTKLSPTPGKVPLVENLASGELALNTNDAILFMKKTIGGVDSVVRVGAEMSPVVAAALKETTGAAFLAALGGSAGYSSPVSTTSGTTSGTPAATIPANVRRVHVLFDNVAKTGTGAILLQLGTSDGIENSGYLGSGRRSTAMNSRTTGFLINTSVATNNVTGRITLTRYQPGSNKWIADGLLAGGDSNNYDVAGSKTLAGALDRVRLAADNGTDTFNAGEFALMWEF